jgi:SsrA-binding protein
MAEEKGLTLVPLSMYFKRGKAKVELGVGRGLKRYDKREALKQRDQQRALQEALHRRR